MVRKSRQDGPTRQPGAGESPVAARAGAIVRSLHWSLPVAAMVLFFVSLSHEAARRILALQTVENYGFAVFNQLLWNFSQSGSFAQTIHRGYVDSWMWSGHKAALLPLVGYLYGLRPGPVWLAQIQIGAVALGALPAYALGRWILGGLCGGLLGLTFYFAYPPLYYMALSDYQDIVLAIPALMLALYWSRRKSVVGFGLSALIACAAREEIALMVMLLGFGVSGGWRVRLKYGAIGFGVAAVYLATVYGVFHQEMHYESSAQTQLAAMLAHLPALPPILYDKAAAARFYAGFVLPVQWLALASPLTLLPAAGALAVHLFVNPGNGVDRVWAVQAHIHHLAPLVPLVVAGSLEAAGWVRSRIGRLGRVSRPLETLAAVLLVGWAVAGTVPAWKALGLHVQTDLETRAYPVHPAWKLARLVPAGSTVATDTFASLAISSRSNAYTYDESLAEKVNNGDPLMHLDAILVNRKDKYWVDRAMAREGARVVGARGDYVLIVWR